MTSRLWRATKSGLVYPLSSGGGGGPGGNWSPPSAAIAPFSWYDAGDISTLFKDTAGATPVTADGDLVARINDKSGNGNHLIQATSALRPNYRTGSGKPFLESTGTQYLATSATVTVSDANGQFTAGAGAYPTSVAATGLVMSQDGSTNRIWSLGFDGTPNGYLLSFLSSGANNTDSNTAVSANTAYSFIGVISGTATDTAEHFLNNVSDGSTANNASGPRHAAELLAIMANPGGAQNFVGRWARGAVYPGVLSSTDRGNFHTWLLAGVQ